MITLTIKRADGSIYWTEYFNDQPSAEKWLAVEQTRPYWDSSYVPTFIDNTPPPPTPAQIAAAAAQAAAASAQAADLATKIQAVKAFAAAAPGTLTQAQVVLALQAFMNHYIKINGL